MIRWLGSMFRKKAAKQKEKQVQEEKGTRQQSSTRWEVGGEEQNKWEEMK